MLTKEEGEAGLKLAREAIKKYLTEEQQVRLKPPEPGGEVLPLCFEEKGGVFVTLNKHGTLRGCIGYPYPVFKLKEAIVGAAVSAAVSDPRFPPVTEEELGDLRIEITILTPPRVLRAKPKDLPAQIKIGKHGLIVKRGMQQGLLLPQVATENKWSAEEFLCQTCWKAGLPQDAWLQEGTEVSTFEGQIFKEEK
ncbi:MAG: TIGR00296 family protein [Candidatus Methanophagaceae archaeon]|nr:MAG: TIGR00296 family protein [Methanophagales archaeon]